MFIPNSQFKKEHRPFQSDSDKATVYTTEEWGLCSDWSNN